MKVCNDFHSRGRDTRERHTWGVYEGIFGYFLFKVQTNASLKKSFGQENDLPSIKQEAQKILSCLKCIIATTQRRRLWHLYSIIVESHFCLTPSWIPTTSSWTNGTYRAEVCTRRKMKSLVWEWSPLSRIFTFSSRLCFSSQGRRTWCAGGSLNCSRCFRSKPTCCGN